jgi:hypothetical protein
VGNGLLVSREAREGREGAKQEKWDSSFSLE